MANKDYWKRIKNIEAEIEVLKKTNEINEKEKTFKKSEKDKWTIANYISAFSAIISLIAIVITVSTNIRESERRRIESYYEPMVLNLEFNKEYESIEFDSETLEIKSLMANSLRGFIKESRTIYVASEKAKAKSQSIDEGTILVSNPVRFDEKQLKEVQKAMDPSELSAKYKNSTPILGVGNTVGNRYSTQFMLFEDYRKNKELYMIVHIFGNGSNKTKEQFIFDRHFLLIEGQEIFSLPENELTEEEREEALAFINEYIVQFGKVNSKLRELNLID